MLPEIEKFLDAHEAIKTEVNKAYDEYRGSYSLTGEEYTRRRDAYFEVREGQYDRRDKLVKELLEATDDKLVRFIVQSYLSDYANQAIKVLKVLPATLDELDELAVREGWCGVWTDAVDEAVEAGAIEITPLDNAKRKVRRYLRNEMYEDEANRAMNLIEDYVKLRVESASTKNESNGAE